MPNDAKLGLLAGVAGVVAAAVLSFQNPPPAPPAEPPPQVVRAEAPGAVPAPAAAQTVPAGKPEVEARPVSRTAGDDD
jgi:hypothetical protein